MAFTSSSPTAFTDIHPLIIQTQILPRLDGQSLSSAATTSSYLRSITADDILWSNICKSIWPSTTHRRVHQLISTFPAAHRSFFQDSFQPPITTVKQPNRHRSLSVPISQSDCSSLTNHRDWPSELISAIDIRYTDDIVYSAVEVSDTTTDKFRSSALKIVLKNDLPGVTGTTPIPIIADELVHADDATMSHLKDSVTLSWILIDPTRKRAVNLSSIKPVLAWITNDDVHLRYAVVLPGCGLHETVECRIEVTLGVGKGGAALYLREAILHLQDVGCNYLSGKDFLVISSRVFLERYSIKRKGVQEDVDTCGREMSDEIVRCVVGRSYIILRLLTIIVLLLFVYLGVI